MSHQTFQPRPGENPDEEGRYWRTIRGRKIPFKSGDNFQEKLKEQFKQKLHSKPTETKIDETAQKKALARLKKKYSIDKVEKHGAYFLSPDGDWFGVVGRDEKQHLDIADDATKNIEGFSGFISPSRALQAKAGFIRVGVTDFGTYIHASHTLTNSQRSALKDMIANLGLNEIELDYSPDPDAEPRIKRSLGISEGLYSKPTEKMPYDWASKDIKQEYKKQLEYIKSEYTEKDIDKWLDGISKFPDELGQDEYLLHLTYSDTQPTDEDIRKLGIKREDFKEYFPDHWETADNKQLISWQESILRDFDDQESKEKHKALKRYIANLPENTEKTAKGLAMETVLNDRLQEKLTV